MIEEDHISFEDASADEQALQEGKKVKEKNYLFIDNKDEARFFWRAVSKFPRDHPQIARLFCSKFPLYDYFNVLQFLNDCKIKAKITCFPKDDRFRVRTVPQTTDEELRNELIKADELLKKENEGLGKKRVHSKCNEVLCLPKLDLFLLNLMGSLEFIPENNFKGVTFYRKKSLNLIKQMLRSYLSKIISKAIELELATRYMLYSSLKKDSTKMSIRDKKLIYEAVNLIGGSLKISKRAFKAITKGKARRKTKIEL